MLAGSLHPHADLVFEDDVDDAVALGELFFGKCADEGVEVDFGVREECAMDAQEDVAGDGGAWEQGALKHGVCEGEQGACAGAGLLDLAEPVACAGFMLWDAAADDECGGEDCLCGGITLECGFLEP